MDEDGARYDSGFDDNGPFRVTPEAGGVSLESALRDYGPAAIDDLIPRLRAIAHILDAAHTAGHVHGALHPSKVIVHDETTSVVAGSAPIAPYAAPELADGPATAASDQYALAVIAYEWMFGRPINHPADRPIDVRTMPGVDRVTLSAAFTRALAPNPKARFASCNDFCSAVADAVVQDPPLLAFDIDDDPVEPFIPENPDLSVLDLDDMKVADSPLATSPIHPEPDEPVAAPGPHPDLDVIDPAATRPVFTRETERQSPPTSSRDSQRFGGVALILATLVGAIFGFAAGYMARPRALQSGPVQEIAQAPPEGSDVARPQDVPAPRTAETPAAPSPTKQAEPVAVGRLLVRSTPSGASVSVDGISKGVTPVAVRDLPLGTRNVTITRRGYAPETRQVAITAGRPSRSLDVRLAADSRSPARVEVPRPSTPATLGKPASSTGALSVDSRPSGAAVTVNGRPSGNTPLIISDLPPGEYRISMAMPGYRNFATTVRVVAGERARAAASLTALEQQ